jgi:hypothetical protein
VVFFCGQVEKLKPTEPMEPTEPADKDEAGATPMPCHEQFLYVSLVFFFLKKRFSEKSLG